MTIGCISRAVFYNPGLFGSYQFGLLHPFTFVTQSSTPSPLATISLLSVCEFVSLCLFDDHSSNSITHLKAPPHHHSPSSPTPTLTSLLCLCCLPGLALSNTLYNYPLIWSLAYCPFPLERLQSSAGHPHAARPSQALRRPGSVLGFGAPE